VCVCVYMHTCNCAYYWFQNLHQRYDRLL